jgi:hypothetical protein
MLTPGQVWSFSPPEDQWDRRSESPISLPEHVPASAEEDEPTQFHPDIGDGDAAMSDV